ncbi:MAG: hypothetical protein GXP55_04175 [Deltaproteobacteria bacterium]|nr:hypothetical protein [Deltaproteobacteria bacterium]
MSRHQREEYRRTQQALQDLSEEQGLAMLQEMRQQAQQAEDDPCDGLFDSFGVMTRAAGRDPIVSESEFRDTCSQMPREMQACFKNEDDQTNREKRYCTRLFGATNPFATTPREGFGPPPGTKRLTRRQRDQINAARRRTR